MAPPFSVARKPEVSPTVIAATASVALGALAVRVIEPAAPPPIEPASSFDPPARVIKGAVSVILPEPFVPRVSIRPSLATVSERVASSATEPPKVIMLGPMVANGPLPTTRSSGSSSKRPARPATDDRSVVSVWMRRALAALSSMKPALPIPLALALNCAPERTSRSPPALMTMEPASAEPEPATLMRAVSPMVISPLTVTETAPPLATPVLSALIAPEISTVLVAARSIVAGVTAGATAFVAAGRGADAILRTGLARASA